MLNHSTKLIQSQSQSQSQSQKLKPKKLGFNK
jgi:hypothetical protein